MSACLPDFFAEWWEMRSWAPMQIRGFQAEAEALCAVPSSLSGCALYGKVAADASSCTGFPVTSVPGEASGVLSYKAQIWQRPNALHCWPTTLLPAFPLSETP